MERGKEKVEFELRNYRFQLSATDVDRALKGVEPGPIAKYRVRVSNTFYPPKQALAAAIKKPVSGFTTIDATRILSRLGFEVLEAVDDGGRSKTTSEALFESYLNASGLTDFEYEPTHAGTPKRPDFCVNYFGSTILFEVKQFEQRPSDFAFAGGAYDPYRAVREKIGSARKKFRDFEKVCCALVLYNNEKPLVELGWRFVYGAMLGNLGYSMPLNPDSGEADISQTVAKFQGGGKMYRYSRQGDEVDVQNRTISAIIVLRHYMVGSKRFEVSIKRKEAILGRKLELDEFWEETQRARGTALDLSLSQIGVVVHENPFARIPFPRELFRGPYDERFGGEDGRIRRIFYGNQLELLEREASETGEAPRSRVISELELMEMSLGQLRNLCTRVAENPNATAAEADGARELRTDLVMTESPSEEADWPAISGGPIRRLKRRAASFLSATKDRWDK
jgi:hypothetical protein